MATPNAAQERLRALDEAIHRSAAAIEGHVASFRTALETLPLRDDYEAIVLPTSLQLHEQYSSVLDEAKRGHSALLRERDDLLIATNALGTAAQTGAAAQVAEEVEDWAATERRCVDVGSSGPLPPLVIAGTPFGAEREITTTPSTGGRYMRPEPGHSSVFVVDTCLLPGRGDEDGRAGEEAEEAERAGERGARAGGRRYTVVYVSDAANHRVVRYVTDATATGGPVVVAATAVVAGGRGCGAGLSQLNHPTGLYVTEDNLTLYVCDTGNDRIVELALEEQQRTAGAGLGEGDRKQRKQQRKGGGNKARVVAGGKGRGYTNCRAADRLSQPVCVSVVPSTGDLIVLDAGNNRLVKWPRGATTGIVLVPWCGYHPVGLCILPDLSVVMLVYNYIPELVLYPRIADPHVDLDQKHVRKLLGVVYPVSMSLDAQSGAVYVTDRRCNRVLRVDAADSALIVGPDDDGAAAGGSNLPTRLAVVPSVAHGRRDGGHGTGEGELYQPSDAQAHRGNLYIVDHDNRVLRVPVQREAQVV